MSSPYMQWSKEHAHVKYNLASSGVTNYPLAKLPVKLKDLEITGDSFYGYAPLMEALSKKCHIPVDHIFSTIGTSLANHLAMTALIQPGDEVVIELPTYELILSTARYLGAKVKRFFRHVEERFQVSPEEIERVLTRKTKLIVLTNLHNPSSNLTDEKTLSTIGMLARSVGARVLVDEVYLDAAFDHTPRSAAHLGNEFVVTNSLTKVYGLSGLRCGWVLAEPDLIQKMWYLNDLFESIPPHPSERMSVIALNHLDEIREHSKSLLDDNRKVLREFLKLRENIEGSVPEIGTVAFLRLKRGNVDHLCEDLRKKYNTALAPGRFFEMQEYFRIGIGCQPEILRKGLEHLALGIDSLCTK